VGERDRVVAGVEAEHWRPRGITKAGDQFTDLVHGDVSGICSGRDSAGVHGGGPGVVGPVQGRDPLVGPAGDDGLPGRVFGRGIVVPALGAGLGVAARPGRCVHGEHQWPGGWAVFNQQVAHRVGVNIPPGQRLVQAAVTAPENRLQTQHGHRADRRRRAQGCVAQLEGRVGPAGQASVEAAAEAPQPLSLTCPFGGHLCAGFHRPSSVR